jgi:hypothetical protein
MSKHEYKNTSKFLKCYTENSCSFKSLLDNMVETAFMLKNQSYTILKSTGFLGFRVTKSAIRCYFNLKTNSCPSFKPEWHMIIKRNFQISMMHMHDSN